MLYIIYKDTCYTSEYKEVNTKYDTIYIHRLSE